MKKIGERLKAARLAQHLNQEELAERIGAKYRSVSTWENGTAKPDCLTIIRICEVLKISPNHLLGYNSSVDAPTLNEMAILHKFREIDEIGKDAVTAVLFAEHKRVAKPQKARLLRLDFYNYPASAGVGNFLENENPDEILAKECSEAEAADYVIPISGNSMEPTLHDGDRVFVEKCSSISEGEIGIFVVDGEVFVKELGDGVLISHNPAYKPISLRAKSSIYCLGKVLGVAEC